jgi:hypothetical protein
MKTCGDYQDQLFDALHGLLDEPEEVALAQHLLECAACRQALERAEGQKRLLAAAARFDYPGLAFDPPAETLPIDRSRRVPRQPSRPLPGGWRRPARWAVAAALLLALGALAYRGADWYREGRQLDQQAQLARSEYDRLGQELRAAVAEQQGRVARLTKEYDAASARITELENNLSADLLQVEQAVRARQLNVAVVGQETVVPGAPNDYHIETRNWNDELVRAELEARVLDGARVVYEEKGINSPGKYRLSLPRDLQVKPGSALELEIVARREAGQQVELKQRLALGRSLFVTHLATDKPMYLPGETVHYRSLALERFSLKPAAEDFRLVFTITNPHGEVVFQQQRLARLTDEQGKELLGPDRQPIRGIGAGQFILPDDLPGGEYVLTVSEASHRFLPETRKFLVNRYEKPRLNKELEFTRKSYGPGEAVTAACKFTPVQGGAALIGKPVTATVLVDGKQYDAEGKEAPNFVQQLRTDAAGGVLVRFTLPRLIERGEAILAVRIDDGGNVETLVRPIPIVLRRLSIEFFPEGGDLVAGVPNRVYFQARTPLGKPAEVKGRIVGPQGQVVARVETRSDPHQPGANQGMGRFEFVPMAGASYELKIDSPEGIEGEHRLPNVTDGGVAMSVPTGLTGPREPIRVLLYSSERDRNLLIGAYCRGRLLDHARVAARKGQPAEVLLSPEAGIGGVYRLTVFEERATPEDRQELLPVAERLVYRQSAGRLNLAVKPDRPLYAPGDRVRLQLTGTQEQGEPAGAVLLVAVVDKSVLTLADDRTARTLPTHFFLTHEVKKPQELEYADFFLTDHPRAAEALDLLLGTQGWRRFAEQDPGNFREQHKEEAERLLVTIGQMQPRTVDFAEEEGKKVIEKYRPKLEAEQARLWKVEAELEALAENDGPGAEAQQELDSARSAYLAALGQLSRYQDSSRQFRNRLLLGLGGGLLLVSLVCLVIGLVRSMPRAMPYFASGAAAMALCGLVLLGTFVVNHREQRVTAEAAAPDAVVQTEEPFGFEFNPAWKRAGGFGGLRGAIPEDGMMPPAPGREQADANARPVPGPGALEEREAKGQPAADNAAALQKAADVAEKLKGEAKDAEFDDLLQRQEQAADNRRQQLNGLVRDNKFRGKKLDEQLLRKNLEEVDRVGRLLHLGPGAGAPPAQAAQQPQAGRFARPVIQPPPPASVVRVYAHQRAAAARTPTGASDPSAEARRDYAETLFWHPAVVLADGQAEVAFQLCDSVTSFQVTVFGHTIDGRLGAATALVESRLPFALEPKLPVEVSASDTIDLPVAITNDSEQERVVDLRLAAAGLQLQTGSASARLALGPNERQRRFFRLLPTLVDGQARLTLSGVAEPFAADQVQRQLRVVPDGFPIVAAHSDMLEKIAAHRITLPGDWLKGTLRARVTVYPSTLAELQKGLEALLQEPSGCFEQTSSSNYPNLLILDYLQESDQARPEVARRARELLERGYHKLLAFECQDPARRIRQGYEWFGGNAPPHEALTAYGLLQFRDMARVYPVDSAMLERTRQYLLKCRDGKGGFSRNPQALDTFGRAPQDITNAYIVWALTESGQDDDLARELDALEAQAQQAKDPYFLALVANSLLNRDRRDAARAVLTKLAQAQQKSGVLDGAQTSITASGGRDLHIETTALALLAWLKSNQPEFQPSIRAAVAWLGQQRGGEGGFGSTQSTILALKALIAHTRANKKTPEAGVLTLFVGERPVGRLPFPKGAAEALVLELDNPEQHLRPGHNDVRLEITGDNVFPYTLTWSYRTRTPASADNCPVRLATRLDRDQADEGETVRLTVQVENRSGQGQGMTVAIVGLPAGLTLPEDMKQLKDLARLRDNDTRPGLISAWETRGRELVLYWRDLAPDQKIELNLDLIARVPGQYRGPASRAYLYYNADHKHWVEPLAVTITPEP